MKWLDRIEQNDILEGDEHRVSFCPNDYCLPVYYNLGTNGAGICCGVDSSADDLDIIRICEFLGREECFAKDPDSDPKILSRVMTPSEACSMASALMNAVASSLTFNSVYCTHHQSMSSELERNRVWRDYLYGGKWEDILELGPDFGVAVM